MVDATLGVRPIHEPLPSGALRLAIAVVDIYMLLVAKSDLLSVVTLEEVNARIRRSSILKIDHVS